MSQGIPVFIATAHRGLMWLAPRPAAFDSLLALNNETKLGGGNNRQDTVNLFAA